MSQSRTLFLGMEVHKDAMAVASVAQDHGAEVTYRGSSGTRQCDIDHLIRQMQSKAKHLIFVYEAGPCGSGLSRYLTKQGEDCGVVAPALIPKKAADRVTTDCRDAGPLARLARSGDRTAVSVPTGAEEAMRDRTRAREDALSDGKDAQCRLKAFVLRHAIRYTGRATWNPAHLRGLSAVVGPPPAQPIVFQDDVRAVPEHTERRQRLAQELQERGKAWRLHPVVEALQGLRGVQCTVAVTTVAERGDLTRFATPRERMKFLGLIPSAYSSGACRRHGAMTKAGHSPARRALVEGAGAYRYPAQVRRPLHLRREKPPQAIHAIRWKAQGRLCKRYRKLIARGTHAHQVVVAMARALIGCMWARAKESPVTP